MNEQNPLTHPTLPQCGPEQEQPNIIARPSQGQKRSRTETRSRHTWSKDDNIQLMKLYFQSNPSRTGYRRRLHSLWMDAQLFTRSEQQLADQARSIRNNNLLSDIELLEIQGSIPQDQAHSSSEFDSTRGPSQKRRKTQNLPPPQEGIPTVSQTIRNIRQSVPTSTSNNPSTPSEAVTPDDVKESITLQLKTLLDDPSQIQVRSLRHVNRNKLKLETALVNSCLAGLAPSSISETNTLLLAGAHVVRERLGEKPASPQPKERKDPFWKRRIEEKIAQLRKDISYLEEIKKGVHLKQKIHDDLNRRHPLLKKKGISCVAEELKQRLRSKAAKIKRYNKRIERFNQNKLFSNNQKQFYRNIKSSDDKSTGSPPNKEECLNFWRKIWEEDAEHNEDAAWIPCVREELGKAEEQSPFVITETLVTNRVRKMANWSSPGMDGLNAFWLKHFSSLHESIALQLMECLTTSSLPEWMTTGRTYLLMKDPVKGPLPSNYRPITCLPVMWKLFSGLISDSIYHHLDTQNLLPPEQKGCKRNSRGCKEQLMIDKLILKNCKRRKQNLFMTFIDYKKAYDRVPHSWILSCMSMCGISPTIINLFNTSFKQSSVDLMFGSTLLGRVKIKRGIFQGDSVSPLHFIISLLPLSFLLNQQKLGYSLDCKDGPSFSHRLYMDDLKLYASSKEDMETLVHTTAEFSKDIKMEFGLDKCATVKIIKGKKAVFEGISLPDGHQIDGLDNEGYKYLGILESNAILHKEMKEMVSKEYVWRVKKVLKSQLHGKFSIQAINTWAVPLVRYGAGILNWTAQELKALDTKTRKLMRINGAHHPQGDVDRLYVSRQFGGRGLHSIEEVVRREENALTTFVKKSADPEIALLTEFFIKDKILLGEEIDKDIDSSQREEQRRQKWTGKVLHGQFPRQMEPIADPSSWSWMVEQDLKKETEGLLIAAQDQALRTNYIKHKIDKVPGSSPLCRLCRSHNETTDHILNGCPKLSQTEYKARHDKVSAAVHWSLCKEYGFDHSSKWYEHRAEKVLENDDVKLLWDFHVQSDHVIEHCRPDLLLVKKKSKEAIIIDIAVPGDVRITDKEQDKILKYQDLKREIKTVWQLRKVSVVPIVIGALGAVTPNFRRYLDSVSCKLRVSNLQKTALLGSAHILRKVLEI